MLSDYYAYCYKYDWSSVTTDPAEVSFFADNSPVQTDSINLNEYAIDVDDIDYSFEDVAMEKGENNKYQIASNVTFTLSGLVNDKYLKTFFGMYEDTTFIKFLVEIKQSGQRGTLIYKGVVHQEGISEQFNTSPDSEQIEMLVIGLEKEFKEYYSGVLLKAPGEVAWEGQIQYPYVPGFTAPTVHYKAFDTTIEEELFTSTFLKFDVEPEVAANKVVKECVLFDNAQSSSDVQVGTNNGSDAGQNFMRTASGCRNQFLYTATELLNVGLAPGEITSIAFLVLAELPGSGNNEATEFYVKMKNTSTASLTDFESGASQVYYRATQLFTTYGVNQWMRLELDTGFEWDGSNLLIEVCNYDKDTDTVTLYTQSGLAGKWINAYAANGGCAIATGSDMNERPACKFSIDAEAVRLYTFIKNSYTRAYSEDLSRFDFFKYMCESMGWGYMFVGETLTVKNRTSIDMPTVNIDYTNFIEYSISKTRNKVEFDTVIVPDGAMYTGTNLIIYSASVAKVNGRRIHVLDTTRPTQYQMPVNWFNRAIGSGGYKIRLIAPYNDYEFYRQYEDDNMSTEFKDKTLEYKVYTWDEDNLVWGEVKYDLKRYRILMIDGGENSSKMFKVNGVSGANSESETTTPTDDEMVYFGNYGNALIKVNTYGYLSRTYLDYVDTTAWRNNFMMYFKGVQNIKLDVVLNEFHYNPKSIINIDNSPDMTGDWQIIRLMISLKDNTSGFELIKLVE